MSRTPVLLLVFAVAPAVAVRCGAAERAARDLTLVQTVRTVAPPRAIDSAEAAVTVQTLQLHGHWGRSVSARAPRAPGGQDQREFYVNFKKKRIYEIDRFLKSYHRENYGLAEKIQAALDDDFLRSILKMKPGRRRERFLDMYHGKDPTRAEFIRVYLEKGPFRAKMMRKYGISAQRVAYTVKETGETRKICGYTCSKLVLLADGKPNGNEAWVTTDITIHEGIYGFLKGQEVLDAALVDEIKKVKGVPLAYTITWASGNVSRTVTTRVSRKRLPPKLFAVPPKGFKRQEKKQSKRN